MTLKGEMQGAQFYQWIFVTISDQIWHGNPYVGGVCFQQWYFTSEKITILFIIQLWHNNFIFSLFSVFEILIILVYFQFTQ